MLDQTDSDWVIGTDRIYEECGGPAAPQPDHSTLEKQRDTDTIK